jgi:hypothetical protein
MARGGPDFGAIGPRVLGAPALDPGELAVRLGSPVALDRLGNVLLMASGGELVRWASEALGSATVDAVPLPSLGFGYAARLFTSANLDKAAVNLYAPNISAGGIGVEAVWTPLDLGDARPRTGMVVDDGTNRMFAGVRWNPSTGDYETEDDTGTWVAAPVQPADLATQLWQSWKVVIDPATQTFIRVLINGLDIGVSGDALQVVASTNPRINTHFTVDGFGATDWLGYLAALITTVNEI